MYCKQFQDIIDCIGIDEPFYVINGMYEARLMETREGDIRLDMYVVLEKQQNEVISRIVNPSDTCDLDIEPMKKTQRRSYFNQWKQPNERHDFPEDTSSNISL